MTELIVNLIPLALGIIMSPLAIMALVAVLVSKRARVNGIAFLVGWALAVVVAVFGSVIVFGLLDLHKFGELPLWVAIVRLLFAVLLIGAAVWTFRKGHAHVQAMASASTPRQVVAAAPQLPGWLRAVENFTAFRSLLLGFGIFLLNPVDATCGIIAGLDMRTAEISEAAMVWVAIVFCIVGILPIAIPVLLAVVKGREADAVLQRVRTWIAGHTSALNAGLLLLIGAMQLQKALSALFGA